MGTTTSHLNLARKWRSQQFDQIIGQDLCVRMLKNSLYLKHLFPVYLFSGQRGCGKTTTARVFASAVNCHAFDDFTKEPKKYTIPCLKCASCSAMLAGKHPDFIEIDAASHTGVDNVRQIIDACSLMPLMGRKKIYLIDEAHMLSKAAFNAFLKILEEPPASVLFILATTDPEKIIETVRSRCFRLFFNAIESPVLLNHLEHVCTKEAIHYDTQGLELIVKETEGSARDALNMLETVRFSSGNVTKDAVLALLGHVEDDRIIALLQAVLRCDSSAVIKMLADIPANRATAQFVWKQFLQLLRSCIWIKHGVTPEVFTQHHDVIKKMIHKVCWQRLNRFLGFCYSNEQIFLKTVHQHDFFQMILLQLCGGAPKQQTHSTQGSSGLAPVALQSIEEQDMQDDVGNEEIEEEDSYAGSWKQAVFDIAALDDPVVGSVFKQTVFRSFDEKSGVLEVELCKTFTFFKDAIDAAESLWMNVLQKHFGPSVRFVPQFTNEKKEKKVEVVRVAQPMQQRAQSAAKFNTQDNKRSFSRSFYKKRPHAHGPLLDISQKDAWPKTHLLLHYFSGTVHEYHDKSSV